MTIDVFANEVMNAVQEKMDGYDVSIQPVVKMNDRKLYGLVIKSPDCSVGPTMYVESAYEDNKYGKPIDAIAREFIDTYYECTSAPMPVADDIKLDWESVKDKIGMRLVGTERNKQYLEDKPHIDLKNGLSVLFEISVSDNDDGCYSLAITNTLAKDNGYGDAADLYIRAFDTNQNLDAPVLTDIGMALFGGKGVNLLDEGEPVNGEMYVLTTESATNGAKAIYYKGVANKVHNILGCDYYALPSSIHEFIIVPDNGTHSADDLLEIVKGANSTVVNEEDVLADAVYHYSNNELKRVA